MRDVIQIWKIWKSNARHFVVGKEIFYEKNRTWMQILKLSGIYRRRREDILGREILLWKKSEMRICVNYDDIIF